MARVPISYKLINEKATPPKRITETSDHIQLYPCETTVIAPKSFLEIDCGVVFTFPKEMFGQILTPTSMLSFDFKIVETIVDNKDSHVKIQVFNTSKKKLCFKKENPIACMVMKEYASLVLVTD